MSPAEADGSELARPERRRIPRQGAEMNARDLMMARAWTANDNKKRPSHLKESLETRLAKLHHARESGEELDCAGEPFRVSTAGSIRFSGAVTPIEIGDEAGWLQKQRREKQQVVPQRHVKTTEEPVFQSDDPVAQARHIVQGLNRTSEGRSFLARGTAEHQVLRTALFNCCPDEVKVAQDKHDISVQEKSDDSDMETPPIESRPLHRYLRLVNMRSLRDKVSSLSRSGRTGKSAKETPVLEITAEDGIGNDDLDAFCVSASRSLATAAPQSAAARSSIVAPASPVKPLKRRARLPSPRRETVGGWSVSL